MSVKTSIKSGIRSLMPAVVGAMRSTAVGRHVFEEVIGGADNRPRDEFFFIDPALRRWERLLSQPSDPT